MSQSKTVNEVKAALEKYRLRFGTEQLLQEDVAKALAAEGIEFEREYRLTRSDRIDFYLPTSKIGIECKTQGSFSSIVAQLLRYAHNEHIDSLILVTRRRSHTAIIKHKLGGKPFVTIWIGASGL